MCLERICAVMSSARSIDALRCLTDEQRTSLLVCLESDAGGLTKHRALRQAEIVRRCLLGNQAYTVVCAELGISRQQFYADRELGIKRALELLKYNWPAQRKPAGDEPLASMLCAMSLFDAGEAERAGSIVDKIPDHGLSGLQLLERFGFELDIDTDLGRDRYVARRGRLHQLAATLPAYTLPFIVAAMQWNELLHIAGMGNDAGLELCLTKTLDTFKACEALDSRTSVVRARLLSNIAIVQLEAGHFEQARDSIAAATRIASSGDAIAHSLRALVHANAAYVYAAKPETHLRSVAEREQALLLGRTHALPRAVWVGLFLRIPDSIWSGDNVLALQDATELRNYVEFSDSRTWRDIAATRLSNAFSALGRFDEAEDAIGVRQNHASALGFALQHCAITHRRGRFAQVLAESARIRTTWPKLSKRYEANGLLYSADAASRIGDMRRARADIDLAISITDAEPPALYIAQRIYGLAHRLTGRRRYRDAADDLAQAVEATASSPFTIERGLTPRQREVALLAAAGASNREIAAQLGLSARTVANHLAAAFKEFGIRARWQLPKAFN